MRWKFTTLLSLGLLLMALGLPTIAQNNMTDNTLQNTITVTGTGSAQGEPDIATIEIGVEFADVDVASAYSQANSTLDAVITAIQDSGVAREDIRTIGFNIYNQGPAPQSDNAEIQYRVANRVNVIVRDITQIEAVIDAAINAGANNVFGLNFDIADRTALEKEARQAAVDDARVRAQDLAKDFNVELGDPVIISEGLNNASPLPAATMNAGGGGASIETGRLTVTLQVKVSFAITASR